MNIKKYFLTVLAVLYGLFSHAQKSDSTANDQHKTLGMALSKPKDGLYNKDPKAAWFPKAGLGLFIHWGMAAVDGGVDLSWGMLANKTWTDDGTLTPNKYFALADQWKPTKYDPKQWAKVAKAAGFQYAVMVTKHHDGFTLWPSKTTDWGVQSKMNGRNLIKEFVDAFRAEGIRIGFYYSPPDWHFDRKYKNWNYAKTPFLNEDHQVVHNLLAKPAGHDNERRKMVAAQVRELLTLFGHIDLLWFDGGDNEISNDEVRKLQPGIVINNRNGSKGDYGDSEGKLPETRFTGWFETCETVWPDRWWTYSTSDVYNDAATVLTKLIKLRAWGGNLLANVGPMANGLFPQPAISAMNDMAVWMKKNKESVVDVQGAMYPEKASVPVTMGHNAFYAFALPAFQGEIKISTLNKPTSVTLLENQKPVPFTYKNNTLVIKIPAQWRNTMPNVVKIITTPLQDMGGD